MVHHTGIGIIIEIGILTDPRSNLLLLFSIMLLRNKSNLLVMLVQDVIEILYLGDKLLCA
jgi:hypothetical protein